MFFLLPVKKSLPPHDRRAGPKNTPRPAQAKLASLRPVPADVYLIFLIDMVQLHIIFCPRGQILLFQVIAHISGYQPVYDRKCRHADDHSHKAKKPSKEQDGKQDPETGKSRGIPQDLRSQDIAVKLLQYQDEYKKIQALHGAYHQDQEGAWNRSDKGSEKRNDIGHADNHADKEHIRQKST